MSLEWQRKKEMAKALAESLFAIFDSAEPITLEDVTAIVGMAVFVFFSMVSDKIAEKGEG